MIFARTDHEETQLDAVAIIDIVHWLLVGNDSAVAEARVFRRMDSVTQNEV